MTKSAAWPDLFRQMPQNRIGQAFNEDEVQNMILKINVLLWQVVFDGTIELVENTFIFKDHELERNTKRKYECIRNSNMKVFWALSCVEGQSVSITSKQAATLDRDWLPQKIKR
jgi:hypothetical protein